jgi:hypothetical protein
MDTFQLSDKRNVRARIAALCGHASAERGQSQSISRAPARGEISITRVQIRTDAPDAIDFISITRPNVERPRHENSAIRKTFGHIRLLLPVSA